MHLDLDNLRIPADVALYRSDPIMLPKNYLRLGIASFRHQEPTNTGRDTPTSAVQELLVGLQEYRLEGNAPNPTPYDPDNVMTLRGTAGFGAKVTAVNRVCRCASQ